MKNPAPPTVYRALDFLLEQGLVHKLEMRSGTIRTMLPCSDQGAAKIVNPREQEIRTMPLKQAVLTAALATPLVLIAPWGSAEDDHHHDHDAEHRQHGAHVHGIAALNLALEDNEVRIELDSPASNIVGFEHAPSSEDDHAALDTAVATLKDGDRLFKLNDEAGCGMETATVTSELLHEEHDEHQGHAEEDGHDHAEHEGEHEGETHSDIEAAYHFECDTPGKLTSLTVELFEAFSGMEKINVQYVIESKQGAAELTAKDHVVKF